MSKPVNVGDDIDAVSFQLGNFAFARFVIDGIPCNSAEGFIQSLKFRDLEKQCAICQLVGIEAKYAGKKAGKRIEREGTVFWKGKPAAFRSEQHQRWIADGIREKFQQHFDSQFDLISTGDRELIHETGRPESRFTSLTANEFVSILNSTRKNLIASTINILSDEYFKFLWESVATAPSRQDQPFNAADASIKSRGASLARPVHEAERRITASPKDIHKRIRFKILSNEAVRSALIKSRQRPFFAELHRTEHPTTLHDVKQFCGILFRIRNELSSNS